jgi:hypothetical protein
MHGLERLKCFRKKMIGVAVCNYYYIHWDNLFWLKLSFDEHKSTGVE